MLKSASRKIIIEGRSRHASAGVKRASAKVSVFLSHSHADRQGDDLVDHARNILWDQDIDLYVDADDSGLPVATSPETAKKIKGRIREMGKFILLATPRSLRSVWCGWELGVADSLISTDNVVIWPITQKLDSSPANHEYIGLYPRLIIADDGRPAVFPPRSTSGVYLKHWLLR